MRLSDRLWWSVPNGNGLTGWQLRSRDWLGGRCNPASGPCTLARARRCLPRKDACIVHTDAADAAIADGSRAA